MSLWHRRWSRRVALLAAGALGQSERDATLQHLAACPGCARERAAFARLLEGLGDDPSIHAEPPLPLGAFRTRVEARLDAAARAPRGRRGLLLLPAVGAALTLLGVIVWLGGRARSPESRSADATRIEIPKETVARLERQVTRERTARYLTEAQDVLVTVASTPRHCDRRAKRVDVREETRRSRALLARRALVVDLDDAEVASARGILEEVEERLRQVASLDPCAQPAELAALQEEIEHSRLLMKIDLVTRELAG